MFFVKLIDKMDLWIDFWKECIFIGIWWYIFYNICYLIIKVYNWVKCIYFLVWEKYKMLGVYEFIIFFLNILKSRIYLIWCSDIYVLEVCVINFFLKFIY